MDNVKGVCAHLRRKAIEVKLNNVLIDEKTDKGLCVIDLDTVILGSVLYDFGM